MILITGSGGKTGRAVAGTLQGQGHPLRLFRRSGSPEDPTTSAEIFFGDLEQVAHLKDACRGVKAVYHIGPNMHPREDEIGMNMIQAAQEHGVEHVVLHSVLYPQIKAMPHHWRKLTVERSLIQSGLSFTILQPAAYFQNVGNRLSEILRDAEYKVPYPIETKISLVDLSDVAQVAGRVMLNPAHYQAIYPLVGQQAPDQLEVADIISHATGRKIQAIEVPLQDWANEALGSGMSPGRVEDFLAMFRYYADHDFIGNPGILEHLCGPSPTDLESYFERLMKEQRE